MTEDNAIVYLSGRFQPLAEAVWRLPGIAIAVSEIDFTLPEAREDVIDLVEQIDDLPSGFEPNLVKVSLPRERVATDECVKDSGYLNFYELADRETLFFFMSLYSQDLEVSVFKVNGRVESFVRTAQDHPSRIFPDSYQFISDRSVFGDDVIAAVYFDLPDEDTMKSSALLVSSSGDYLRAVRDSLAGSGMKEYDSYSAMREKHSFPGNMLEARFYSGNAVDEVKRFMAKM